MTKKYIIALFIIAASSFSCKKFLEVKPKSQIKEDLLFEKETGFLNALTGVYTLMARRDLYGDKLTMSFLDLLAQRYKSISTASPYIDVVKYNYEASSPKSTIRTIWLSSYACIANVNSVLGNIEERKDVFKDNNYNLVKGEALGLRAFLHFDLLRMFGPVMANDPTAKSIPYRTMLNKEAQPLLPANEVVKLIIQDLLQAEELLKNDPIITGEFSDNYEFNAENRKYRMNYLAVQATLARVYQYNNQPAEAYTYAKKVIASGKFTFVTNADISTTGACRDRLFRNEHLFALQISNMKVYTDAYFNVVPNTYEDVVLNNDDAVINEVFENVSTDYRRQYLWESKDGKLLHTKYLQFESSPSQCNYVKNLVPVERISEMYYIAAECSPDLGESISLLNVVRNNRGLEQLTGVDSKGTLQAAITKEYQKEFFSEGQLFYYYKRNRFTNIPGSTVPANNSVYVLPVPEDELIFN